MPPEIQNKPVNGCPVTDSAVSETIGAILLVSVAVIAVSVIGVTMFSQPTPQEVPSVNAIISNESNVVYMLHEGGDTVRKEAIRVYVDGQDVTGSVVFPADNTWGLGDQLVYTGTTIPQSVSIVYLSGGSAASILGSRSFTAESGSTGGGTGSGSGASSFYINATSGPNGTITPSGTIAVGFWETRSFSISPDFGYHVGDVAVDSASVGAVTSYTFSSITASHTIMASFAPNTYVITASAGPNGTVSPGGNISVSYGASQNISIIPNTGFKVSDVVVDNVSRGALSGYSFTHVSANHTLVATFTPLVYTITAQAVGSGGMVSPNGTVNVSYGGSASFLIQPSTGNRTLDVLVDGVSQGVITNYTFSNVTANHTLSAAFTGITYTITATAGSGGSISPTSATVNYGGSQSFTITPNSGYAIDSIAVDGTYAGYSSPYTFSNVTANHTISASFYSSPTLYSVYLSASKSGYLLAGSYMQVRVKGSSSSIRIGSTTYSIANNSVVRLTFTENTTGSMYISSGSISSASGFTGVTYSLNGTAVATGTLNSIYISSYTSYQSTMSVFVPANTAWTQFTWNGSNLIYGSDNTQITIYNIGPNPSTGTLNLEPSSTSPYLTGGASAYSLVVANPAITSISPSSGTVGNAWTSFTISGTNFLQNAVVTLTKSGQSNITATTYSVQTGTITGNFDLSSASNGTWNVVVTNPNGGTATLSGGFTITYPAPDIYWESPSTLSRGNTYSMTIYGTNFRSGASAKLTYGSSTITGTSVSVASSSQMSGTFVIPSGASTGSWTLTVTNDDGQYDTDSVTIR